MAEVRISNLPDLDQDLDLGAEFAVSQAGTTYKASTSNIKASLVDNLSDGAPSWTTSGDLTSNSVSAGSAGDGRISLTVDDTHGSANIAFNHKDGKADVVGSSARITSSVDSSSASLDFQLKDATVNDEIAFSCNSKFEITTSEIKFKTFATIPTNKVGSTPESIVNKSYIDNEIALESNARVAGDNALNDDITALDTRVTTEISDRVAGDEALDTRVTSETNNRVAGDNALDTRVTALDTRVTSETNNRVAQDNALNDDITALDTRVTSETDNRVAGDNALDTRVTALETATIKAATYTRASTTYTRDSITVSGYTRTDPDNLTSESSGVITINEAGTYLVWFNGEYSEDDGDGSDYFRVEYKIGSNVTDSKEINGTGWNIYERFSSMTVAAQTNTLSIRLAENPATTLYYKNIQIQIFKLA